MTRHVVMVVGVGLAMGCGQKQDPEPPPEIGNPPVQRPTWDDVKTTHPEGATNPPHPILIVSPNGVDCYKKFVGGMIAGPPDHVEDCAVPAADCGTLIECPQPRAAELLAASKAPPVPG